MKKYIKKIVLLSFVVSTLCSCNSWFDVTSRDILSEEDTFSTADGITSVAANIYSRLKDFQGFSVDVMNDWDESIRAFEYQTVDYGDGYQRYYDYGLIREINLFLENIEKYGQGLNPIDFDYFKAEGRFLRAYTYFMMAKTMGGVPLVLESYVLNDGDDASKFYIARSKEEAIYEFILKEVDEIKEDLDVRANNVPVKNRASKGAALALRCRAALYAGSIAKYTAERSDLSLTLSGGETGIPRDRANYFYEECIKSADEIINMGVYKLYTDNANKIENFYEVLTKKNANNPEVIFVKDHDGINVENHFTGATIQRSMRSTTGGSSEVGPTLNLVESYGLTDGTNTPLKTVEGEENYWDEANNLRSNRNYIIYDSPIDIFAGRDPRLFGTILTPGSDFRSKEVQLWAGLAVWNTNGEYEFKSVANVEDLYGTNDELKYFDGRQMTGLDGPHYSTGNVTNTGFLLRKYVDSKPGSEMMGQSDLAYVRFRLGEVYLNAAEAAMEIGQKVKALEYINKLRERAGVALFTDAITINDIRNERRIELAFEDHRFNDVKRWRIGDRIFDGNRNTSTALILGLWPYKIYRPGHQSDGKWIFRRVRANKRHNPVRFINSNYYTSFTTEDIGKNPLLVKNPYQN